MFLFLDQEVVGHLTDPYYLYLEVGPRSTHLLYPQHSQTNLQTKSGAVQLAMDMTFDWDQIAYVPEGIQ